MGTAIRYHRLMSRDPRKGPTIQKWKFTRRAIKEIKIAPNTFKDSFSIIHILQNDVDKKIWLHLMKGLFNNL